MANVSQHIIVHFAEHQQNHCSSHIAKSLQALAHLGLFLHFTDVGPTLSQVDMVCMYIKSSSWNKLMLMFVAG